MQADGYPRLRGFERQGKHLSFGKRARADKEAGTAVTSVLHAVVAKRKVDALLDGEMQRRVAGVDVEEQQ